MPASVPRPKQKKPSERSPAAIAGVILAMAVIRMRDRQDGLDNLTEQSVSTGCPDHQGEPQ
ncbi:hypothetical protein [Zwartia panacis]|uniref:hypothetical protein n=1 Tax=Zwartia panacis TaxID=2683345 RepID=UPI0025B47575|nr:hypothetical protein [Zwartia panacis]MDN4016144.1 hypothetical protein [Zwartia panacis]